MMQNKKRIIIITGGIGTGKSTAVNILKKLGFCVFDSDKIVHEGYNKGEELYEKMVKEFSDRILNEDKTINTQKLARNIFKDEETLKRANQIVHTYVRAKLKNSVDESDEDVIFLDIPLFLEGKKQNNAIEINYDEVWLVYVNETLQKERLEKRAILENKNVEEVLSVIEKQIPIEEKKTMVDEVINNESTTEELFFRITELLKKKKIGR